MLLCFDTVLWSIIGDAGLFVSSIVPSAPPPLSFHISTGNMGSRPNHWPYSHTSIAREFERLTLKEGCVVSTGVSHKCSWLFHVQPFYGSIVCSQSLLHFSWKVVRTWDAGFWNMIDERGKD
jgi:hypothetical protein